MIDGIMVNGTARLIGWFARRRAPRAVRLRLPLRVHDDHRRVRAAHVLLVYCEALDANNNNDAPGLPVLSLAIWVPIVFGLAVLVVGRDRNAARRRAGSRSRARSLGLLVTHPAVDALRARSPAMQFVEMAPWIPRFNVHYHLGVDGISMPLILLNSLMTRAGRGRALGGDHRQGRRSTWRAFLIQSGLINGVFAALDAILFYVFFEAMLIPMFLIIGVWGGPNRVYAAVKFFLYTLLGSLLMLVAFIYLYIADQRQLRDPRLPQAAAAADGAGADLPRDLHVVRGQGADVAGAHVAARRARRGAHGRLGDPRGDHAQDRRLRVPALQPADRARRLARTSPAS